LLLDLLFVSFQPCYIAALPALVYGNTTVNYLDNIFSKEHIVVNFAADQLSTEDKFEAVVYAAKNRTCDVDTVLGKSFGAYIATEVTDPSSLPFTVEVPPGEGTVKITAPVSSFRYPVTYREVSSCSDLVGGNTNTGDQCGVLEVCVEYQQVSRSTSPSTALPKNPC